MKIKEIESTINAISIANNYKELLQREGYVFVDLQEQVVFMATPKYAFLINFKNQCFYDLIISNEFRYAFFYLQDIGIKIDSRDFDMVVKSYNKGKGCICLEQIEDINNIINTYRHGAFKK